MMTANERYELRHRIAATLTDRTKKRGWTQQQLATASGVPLTTVNDVLNARTFPRIDTLVSLAKTLKLSLKTLCGH